MNNLVYWFESFLEFINVPWVPWALSAAIIGFAVVLAFFFSWFRVRPVRRRLVSAKQLISETPQANFFTRFEHISSELEGDPVLAHTWSEFRETLLVDEEFRVIKNTRQSDVYFNLDSVVAANMNLRFYEAVPNILIGIGLLFTFLGLVAALDAASEGVAAKDVQQTQQSLQELLHWAAFKFVTSIAGLASSLGFSWWEKHQLHRLSIELLGFCQLLDERLVQVTPESLANEHLKEARRQSEQLERFNTDLATQIASALDVKLQENLAKAVAPLADSIKGLETSVREMVDKVGSVNQDALTRMMEQFSESVQASAGDELKSLAGKLEQIGEVLSSMQSQFEESGQSFGSRIESSADAIKAVVELMGKNVGGMETAQIALAEQFQTTVETLRGAMKELDAVSSRLTEAGEQIAQASRPVAASSQKLESIGARLDTTVQQIAGMSESVERLSETLGSATATTEKVWEGYAGRFERLDESLSAVFRELRIGLDAYAAQVREFVNEIDSSLAQSSKLISGAVGELGDTVEELNDSVEKLREGIRR